MFSFTSSLFSSLVVVEDITPFVFDSYSIHHPWLGQASIWSDGQVDEGRGRGLIGRLFAHFGQKQQVSLCLAWNDARKQIYALYLGLDFGRLGFLCFNMQLTVDELENVSGIAFRNVGTMWLGGEWQDRLSGWWKENFAIPSSDDLEVL